MKYFHPNEKHGRHVNDRRRIALKTALLSGTSLVALPQIPEKWASPIVDSVLLPAHAATSISLNVTCDPPESTMPSENSTVTATVQIEPNPGSGEQVKVVYLCADTPLSMENKTTDSDGRVTVSTTPLEKGCEETGGGSSGGFKIEFEYAGMSVSCFWQLVCFLPNTAILMADGSLQPIAALRKGDEIKGMDWRRRQIVNQRVTGVSHGFASSILKINDLRLTSGHALSTIARGWVRALDLRAGEVISGFKKETKVTDINEYRANVKVNNLRVSHTRNFYVSDGKNLFLAHV